MGGWGKGVVGQGAADELSAIEHGDSRTPAPCFAGSNLALPEFNKADHFKLLLKQLTFINVQLLYPVELSDPCITAV